eukprot:UN00707
MLRYDVDRSEFLWSFIRVDEEDVETVAAPPGDWDPKSAVVTTWLRSFTAMSFSKWTKEAQKAAMNLKVKYGVKVDLIALGDLARIHGCKSGM